MRKTLILTLFLACLALAGQAKDQWTLNGNTYDVDTLVFPHPVGPGVTFAKFDLPAMPLKVSVMEMDLTNPYVEMETWLGGSKSVGTETPTNAVARNVAAGRDVIGATNGDFYRTSPADQVGVPTSGQITQGQVMVAPTGRASFVLDDNRKPYVDRVDFSASYSYAGGNITIAKMNNPENTGANRTCLFTRTYGPSTYTCATGKLVLLAPKGDAFRWLHNSTEHCVVEQVIDATGAAVTIPDGKAFLWMQGNHVAHAEAMTVGADVDVTLKVSLRSKPGTYFPMKEMVGGSDHIIMRNGIYEDAWDERHPRTCIGFNADSTRVYFVVIDGRSTESVGVTTRESVGIFTALGAVNAVNLDGGGSSCMVVNGDVVNRPSDGSVRSVGNGLILYSNAPADDEIGLLNFEPRCYNISVSAVTRFSIWGYNQYGVLKTRNLEGCTLSCDEQVGHFTPDGEFIAAPTPANGNLYATYNGVTTTQPVSIVYASKRLRCDSVVIDTNHPYTLEVLGQSGYNDDFVNPATVQWHVDNPTVCDIDPECVVHALADGQTIIIGNAENFNDTLYVRVENPKARVTTVENGPLDPDTWTVTQSGGKNRVVSALDNGLRIAFEGSSSRNAYVRLAKRLQLWGIPDTMRLRIRPGELNLSRITFSTQLTRGSQVLTTVNVPAEHGEEITLDLPTDQWCDAEDLSIYPIQLVYIQINMASPTSGQNYSLDIPGMELIYDYPQQSASGDVNGDGTIDIQDLNIIINVILGQEDNPKADVNGNGITDIQDLNTLISTILGI